MLKRTIIAITKNLLILH